MGRAVAPTRFAGWLDEQLAAREMGVRTLAKEINRRHRGVAIEVARRALNRYLFDGALPTNSYRILIAEALGVDESELPSDNDEEPG